jgi:hypothetical protein
VTSKKPGIKQTQLKQILFSGGENENEEAISDN